MGRAAGMRGADEGEVLRAQRVERRRRARRGARVLSRRGALTAGTLVVTLAFAAGYFGRHLLLGLLPVAGSGTGFAQSIDPSGEASARDVLPAVSAPPPELAVRARPTPAPPAILERLPVSVIDYEEGLRAEQGIDPAAPARWVERIDELPGPDAVETSLPLLVEYTFDAELTRRVMGVLRKGRVSRGHAIVMEPDSGRVLAWVSTDAETFPPDRPYPAASLVKVVTAAAALDHAPRKARAPCLYRGNKYRLTRARIHRPKRGHESSLERALATSNNQCFAQLAVEAVGTHALLSTLDRFGWTVSPAPGHPAGVVDPGEDEYDLGRLGCGLSGCRITPLHAAQLASSLAHGLRVTPWWIDGVRDGHGNSLALPERPAATRVMSESLSDELRAMLVRTTTRGTARSGFRDDRGRPKLGAIEVAGKTGNLTGGNPRGRYEWFIGVAPAEDPKVAVAVVQVQGHLWWAKSSELAADVLREVFCERGRCRTDYANRFIGDIGDSTVPVLLSEAQRD